MRMEKIMSIVLAMVLLASAVPMAVAPAAAQQAGIPCDDGDNELTKEELVTAILPYMLEEEGAHTLDDVGDAAWIYAYWSGKPKTITDMAEREVTVYRSPERIIPGWRGILELLRVVKLEKELIVGVESYAQSSGGPPYYVNYKIFFPEYQDKLVIGMNDPESILSLYPEVVLIMVGPWGDRTSNVLESVGITVLRVHGGVWGGDIAEDAKLYGDIFDKQDEAEEFSDWYENIMNTIKERVEEIPENDKPKVYFEHSKYQAADESRAQVESAGGVNIYPDITTITSVDPESLAEKKPDIIINSGWGCGGYDLAADDTDKFEEIRGEIMSREELQNVTAVKERHVYVLSGYINNYGPAAGCRGFLQTLYMVKWLHSELHPELFEYLDPKAIHQEYLERFQGLDFDLDVQGIFVYPEPGEE